MKKNDFYRLDEIKKKEAQYNILLGERANGKSGAVKEEAVRLGLKTKKVCTALLRRFDEDIKSSVISTYFNDTFIIEIIVKESKGKFNCITFYQRNFYFSHIDEDGKIERGFAFCKAFSIADDERYKSSTVEPNIEIIIFEEFTTNKTYLSNEVTRFMNLCSTILRLNIGRVYMIANKVSRVCPYFSEWCLKNIPKQKEGSIDVYEFEDMQGTTVKIAVELCASPQHKKSGMFFGRVGKQIDGGAWECKEHPHLIGDISDYDILYSLTLKHLDFKFNICLLNHIQDEFLCVYVYPSSVKTHDRILTEEYSSNYLTTPTLLKENRAEVLINNLFKRNKVVFPTNLIGEDFYNILSNMKTNPFNLV